MSGLTVGITTRNRSASLERCLRSLRLLAPLSPHVIIFDDASEVPAGEVLAAAGLSDPAVTVIRDDRHRGYIAGRNAIMRAATTPYVLQLDDDTVMLSLSAVASAMAVLDGDAGVAAVGFAQAEADGRLWAEPMQPGRGAAPVYVCSYIGFSHLLRRETFLRMGGYRESFGYYGEEKDYCLRLLDAGLRVVFLPEARVAHIPDLAGRSATRYVRFAIRNDCLHSLYNEPWPVVVIGLPLRLWRYRRMKAATGAAGGGLRWIAGEVIGLLPDVWRNRRAVSWKTFREWRRLSRTIAPYRAVGPA